MEEEVEVVPGLKVTRELYESAVEGLARHTPHLTVTWESFTSDANWTLVPDPDGRGYKAESVLQRDAETTVKINLWMAPDLRQGDVPAPHSHPWEFTAHVLAGGYREMRYELDEGDVVLSTEAEHRAGGSNHLPLSTYHEVTEVLEPGRTLTLMVCGAGRMGQWGYLDPETGQTREAGTDPSFKERLVALNPRMR